MPADAPGAPRRPKRKLGRRLLRIGLWLLGIAVVLRIALAVATPFVIDAVAKSYGLRGEYESWSLCLLGGSLEVRQLRLQTAAADPEQAATFARMEYLLVDADVSALLTGSLRVHRVEVDGLDVWVERDAAGKMVLPPPAPPPEEPVDTAPPPAVDAELLEPQPVLDFGLPVHVEALRCQHVVLHLRDEALQPPLAMRVDASVRVSHLGSPTEPTRVEIDASADDVVEALRIRASVRGGERSLQADAAVHVAGVHLEPLRPYLQSIGVEPEAKSLGFDLRAEAELLPDPADDLACTGAVRVHGVTLRADRDEPLAIDEILAEVARWSPAGMHLPRVEARGVHGEAGRTADGALAVAGVHLRPVPEAAPAEPPPPAATSPQPEVESAAVRIDRLALVGLRLSFADAAVTPATELVLHGDELAVLDVDTSAQAAPWRIRGRLRAPGIVDAITIDGELGLEEAVQRLALRLGLDGIAPARLRPYLAAAGIENELASGQLRLILQAAVHGSSDDGDSGRIDLQIEDLMLRDGDVELLALAGLQVRDLVSRAEPPSTRIGDVELRGLRLPLAIEPEGVVALLGMRIGQPPVAAPETEPAPTPVEAASRTAAAPTRFELVKLRCRDNVVTLVDRSLPEPLRLVLDRMDVDVDGFRLGGEVDAAEPPARLRVTLASKTVVEALELAGTVTAGSADLDLRAELSITGSGLRLLPLRGYLAAAGVEPELDGGSLTGQLRGHVRQQGTGPMHVDGEIRDLVLRDQQDVECLGLVALTVKGVEIADSGVDAGRIEVVEPRLFVERDADGAMHLCGVRIPPAKAVPLAADNVVEETRSAEPAAAAGASTELGSGSFTLEHAAVRDAKVRWRDAAIDATPFELTASVTAAVDGVQLGSGQPPATFTVVLQSAPGCEELAVAGTVGLDPRDFDLRAELRGRGLATNALQPYFPDGVRALLRQGQLAAMLRARWTEVAAGGHGLDFAIEEMELFDRTSSSEPLFRLDRLAVRAGRLDPAAGVFTVAEAAVEGLAVDVTLDGDKIRLLGLELVPPSPAPPIRPSPEPSPPEPSPPGPIAAAARDRTALPTVQIDKLLVDLAALRIHDAAAAGADPVEVRLRLAHDEPMRILAPDAEDLPAQRLHLRGAITPVVASVAIGFELAPFAAEPHAAIAVELTGIDGAGLLRAMPSLRETLDPGSLRDGSFVARLEAMIQARRRSPVDFTFADGFGAELTVRDVALRGEPEGPVLLGIDSVDVEVKRVSPATGDVHVSTVAFGTPRGLVRQTDAGLEVAGMVLRTPPASDPPIDGHPTGEPPPASQAAPAPTADAPPGPEVRIDELVVQGIDFEFRDDTVSPPLLVPLVGLDVEVKRLTTRALHEPLPVRFSVSLEGGAAPLPERDLSSSLLSGVLGAVAGAVVGTDDEFTTEQRSVFEAIDVRGQFRLVPNLRGWAKVNLAAFELQALRGAAQAAGVEIGDGLLDARVALRFLGDDGVDVDSGFNFKYLSLTEPPGGPISTYLKLPAPLDSVLFLLKNEDDEVRIPLAMQIGTAGLSTGALAGTAASTLGQVIANAVAASPLRVTGTVTGLVGFGGGAAEDLASRAVTARFVGGDATIPEKARRDLLDLRQLIADDPEIVVVLEHRIAAADVAHADVIANPDPGQCREVAARLRQQRDALLRDRGRVAADVRAAHALTPDEVPRLTTELRRLEGALGHTERGLDAVLTLLRPGAERYREKRTRAAARALADQRLQKVRSLLLVGGDSARAERIEVRRPKLELSEPGAQVLATPKRRAQ